MTTEMMVPRANGGSQMARRGFGEESLEQRSGAAAAMAARAQAEVQARYIVAMQRPRDVDEFRVRLLAHCKRQRFAKAARYKKPVGKAFIEGASIRFVETALQEYGNVQTGAAVIFEDADQVVVRVTVVDLERNIPHEDEATIMKRMERRFVKPGQQVLGQRMNSHGDVVYLVEATDDDVANIKAARVSKLLRNLGLRLLPADVVSEAMDACIAAQTAEDAKDPDAARRALVDAFFAIGVSPASLAEYLGHNIEQVVPAELVELRGHYQAIRDGETTWAAILAARGVEAEAKPAADAAPKKGVAAAKEQLRKPKVTKPPQAEEGATPSSAPPPAAAGEADRDPVEAAIADHWRELETIGKNPGRIPTLERAIQALPAGEERDSLMKAIAQAREMFGGEA